MSGGCSLALFFRWFREAQSHRPVGWRCFFDRRIAVVYLLLPFVAGRLSEVGFARFFLCPHIMPVTFAAGCHKPRRVVADFRVVAKMSEFIVDKIRDFLQILLPSLDLELFDVQFRREGHGWVLRVFIDSESGISLDNCSVVSRELGRYLDVEDFIESAYHLEVSSPGLERPLRSREDFIRFCGKSAKVKVHEAIDGLKVLEGIIEKVEDDSIYLKLADGRSVQFTFEMINKARLTI